MTPLWTSERFHEPPEALFEAQVYGKMKLAEDVRMIMAEHTKLLAATDRQQRVRYQEQIEIDRQLIQKQRYILQDYTEHIHDSKSLIELSKKYIENQKRFIQHNRERIEMLKHTVLEGKKLRDPYRHVRQYT